MTAALVGAVLLLIAGYAARASSAVAAVMATRPGALLADLRSDEAGRLDRLAGETVRTAIAATPLNQRLVNVAMARDVKRNGDARTAAWLAVLPRLGWRDTPALQNMLYAAATAGDLSRILDIADALLRRRQLMDQMIPALSMMESDPGIRATFAARLAGGPSWRGAYLTATGHLATGDQLVARYETIRLLQRRGVRLDDGDVTPNIVALDRASLPEYGFALWRSIRPGVTRPLDDTRFLLASRSYAEGRDPVPYQWRMMAGQGFSADASRDGARASLTLNWDGRGVPVFAQQRTSAKPGRHALEIVVPAEDVVDLPAIAFRLMCEERTVAFQPIGSDRYVTAGAVPCAYPVLQVAGEIQASAAPHQLTFERIAMRPLGRASAVR